MSDYYLSGALIHQMAGIMLQKFTSKALVNFYRKQYAIIRIKLAIAGVIIGYGLTCGLERSFHV